MTALFWVSVAPIADATPHGDKPKIAQKSPPSEPKTTTPAPQKHQPKADHRPKQETPHPSKAADETIDPDFQRYRLIGAKEVATWLLTLTGGKQWDLGLQTTMNWLQVWVATNWGVKIDRTAWDTWLQIVRSISLWHPAPLYRAIKSRKLDPNFIAQLKGLEFILRKPQTAQRWEERLDTGWVSVLLQVAKQKRTRTRALRPYILQIQTQTHGLPIKARNIDLAFLHILNYFTDAKLSVPDLAVLRPLLPFLAEGSHSRKIALWLTIRFPITGQLVRNYMEILNVMEPLGNGLYKFDLRTRWKLDALKRDYPRLAKSLQRKDSTFTVSTIFVDRRGRRWMEWSYDRNALEHRIQAVLGKQGFWLCDDKWKPIARSWRPTQMGTRWETRTNLIQQSQQLQFSFNNFTFDWYVRPTKNGANLEITLARNPTFFIRGGQFLRILAKVLISGGIEGLLNRFLYNLTHGLDGKGLHWRWTLKEQAKGTTIGFDIIIPIVPDRVLTSLLRMMPTLMKQSGISTQRKSKRRSSQPLWQRIYHAIYRDIEVSRRILLDK